MVSANYKGKVLIVDDEPMVLKYLTTLLQKEGFRSIPISDSQQAIEYIDESLDLIITDINMPEISGLDLLKQSKQISPETEVVIITAYGTLDLDIEASHLKAFAFLQKPLPAPNELVRIVSEAVQESQTLKQNKQSFSENDKRIDRLSFTDKQTAILVDSISEGALILNEEGLIEYSNLQTAQLIRLPYNELHKSKFSDYFLRSQKVEKYLHSCINSAKQQSFKTRLIDIKGKTLPVRVKFTLLDNEAKSVLVLVQDLAPLKEAQQKATQMARIVETLNYDMILICNTQGIILESNKTAQQDFRYISSELQNSPISKLFQFKHSLEDINNTLDSEGILHLNLKAVRSDGSEFPAKLSLHKQQNEVVCIVKNETDEEFYKEQLKESLKEKEEHNIQLQKLLKSKSEFIASVTHELKTPLNSIIGFSEVLTQSLVNKIEENDEKLLKKINNNGQRLLTLIDSILALKSGEKSKDLGHICEVNINSIVETLIEDFSITIKKKGLELKLLNSEQEILFNTDADKVIQILVNLINNAIKFTEEGHIIIDIKQLGTGMLVIKVIDNGPGISEELCEKIFEPFFQENQTHTRDHEGIGLGLAISQEQAEILGGKITVKSCKGLGSTFTLILPEQKLREQHAD